MEKTYFEIKITFLHILIMLVAVILIGIALFYMGYKAGFRANPNATGVSQQSEKKEKTITTKSEPIASEKPAMPEVNKGEAKTIGSETKLFPPANVIPNKEIQSEKIKSQQNYYAIRVGAFSNQSNARKYAEKFKNAGYLVKVASSESSAKTSLFFVLVGQFRDAESAKTEKEKLEKMENKKFIVVVAH